MSSTIIQSNDLNTSNITFSPIKLLDSGGKQSYLNYGGAGKKLFMQTAPMSLPYGISKFDKQGPVKYHMDLSFRGHDEAPTPANKKIIAFYKAIQTLDAFMIEQGVKNSLQWFKAKLAPEVVAAFYTPLIRVSKDANGNPKPYPPTLKVNLRKPKDSDKFDVKCYNSNKELYGADVPLEDLIVKGAVVVCLMECTGVWFAGSKYGLSWKAVQNRIDSLPDTIRNYAMADDEEGGGAAAPAPAPRAAVAPKAVAPAPVLKEAPSQEDEIDDDDVFEEVAPAPAPVKQAAAPAPAPVKQTPAPAPAPAIADDDEVEDIEPVALPKRKVVTKKTIASAVKK